MSFNLMENYELFVWNNRRVALLKDIIECARKNPEWQLYCVDNYFDNNSMVVLASTQENAQEALKDAFVMDSEDLEGLKIIAGLKLIKQ